MFSFGMLENIRYRPCRQVAWESQRFVSVTDFKQVSSYRLTADLMYEEVSRSDAVNHGKQDDRPLFDGYEDCRGDTRLIETRPSLLIGIIPDAGL